MNQRFPFFNMLCIIILLIFSLFMTIYIPVISSLLYRIDDVSLSLETSYGRENKQQYEYDQVALEIPLIHAEIEEKSPLAFEAESAVIRLKARRNELREKKKNLELELAEYSSVQEETTHE